MKPLDVKAINCPGCGRLLDVVSDPLNEADKVEPGDVSLCIGCGFAFVIGDDMVPREPTDDEMMKIIDRPEIASARRVITYVRKLRRRKA